MSTQIDDLNIKITTDANIANRALTKLAKNLGTLNSAALSVSNGNLDKVANSIHSLANGMNSVKKIDSNIQFKTLSNNNLGSISRNTQKMSLNFKGLAFYIGKFYANYFLFIRGFGKLWSSIKSSMDYLETLNYFQASFEQVASNAVSAMSGAGKESAQAFYDAYISEASKTTSKLTGYTVSMTGNLTQSSGNSLGLNPTKTLQYQAQFAQMSSSMGVASDYATKLSSALTMIGADLASVKNMEFEEVWQDMASGLVGMSRTLDKYGVNIRNVNMQQKLTDMGINANIASLNQQDKALLRTIILLDSTKYAWGDLSDTIEAPANQLRLLSSNLKVTGQLLGNLFLPIVQQVLPYLNGFTMALQRMVVYLGELMGIDLSNFTKSTGASNSAITDILDDAENANEAIEELKNQLMGFDEINKLNDDSSSKNNGVLDSALLYGEFDKALAEYQKTWNEAFERMNQKSKDIADNITRYFAPLKGMVDKIFEGDMSGLGELISEVVKAVFNEVSKIIDSVNWKDVGKQIARLLNAIDWVGVLKSVGNFIESMIEAGIELFLGIEEENPFIAWFLNTMLGGIPRILTKLKNFKEQITKIIDTFKEPFLRIADTIKGIMKRIYNAVADKVNGIIEFLNNTLLKGISAVLNKIIDGLNAVLSKVPFIDWIDMDHVNLEIKKLDELGDKSDEMSEKIKRNSRTSADFILDGIEEYEKQTSKSFDTMIYGFGNYTTAQMNLIKNMADKSLSIVSKNAQDINKTYSTDLHPPMAKIDTSQMVPQIKNAMAQVNNNLKVNPITLAINTSSQAMNALKTQFTTLINGANIRVGSATTSNSMLANALAIGAGAAGLTLRAYATGGFPEDGLFMANHNELVGQFSNGRTAVVNNNQIVEGIAEGIYPAVYDAVYSAMSNTNGSGDVTVNIDGKAVFNAVRRQANSYTMQTGMSAFA